MPNLTPWFDVNPTFLLNYLNESGRANYQAIPKDCTQSYNPTWAQLKMGHLSGFFRKFGSTLPTIKTWIYYSLSAHLWEHQPQRYVIIDFRVELLVLITLRLYWIRLYEFLTKIPSFCIHMIWGYMRDFPNLPAVPFTVKFQTWGD